MKFHIRYSVEIDRLDKYVPTSYKGLANSFSRKIHGHVTLITFPPDRKDLVKGAIVEKALTKLDLPEDQILVVLGGCFSSEAIEKLKGLNVHYLNLSEFHWTDESYIKISGGSPKYEQPKDS